MAIAVQFWNTPDVLKAYDLQGVDTWGIFQGKQFITAGSGKQMLERFLEMLSNGNGRCTYTLKFYRTIEDPEGVEDNSPYSGSFNFVLSDGQAAGIYGTSGGNANVLLARIAALEKEKADRDREDDDLSLKSALIGLLDQPEKIPHLIQGFQMLFGRGMSPQLAVGNVPVQRAGQVAGPEDQQARVQRLSVAIDTLERADPKILEHLESLAKLSKDNPVFFTMLIGQLDKM